MNILKEGSVEAVSLANNHSKDYGWEGLWNTMRVLEEAGIGWARAEDFWIFEKDGIRIAFAGVDHGIFAMSDYILQEKLLQLKKEGKVNAIVMLIHEGKEYSPIHLGNQDKYCEYFINTAGADLVIMHHPHVLQGMEIYNQRTICYSLGNFCFGGNSRVKKPDSLLTAVVQADLTFSALGEYIGQQLRIYPAHISGTYPQSNFQPVRVTGEEADEVIAAFKEYVSKPGDTITYEKVFYTLQPQVSFTVMDYTNGHVLALCGGRGEKTENLGFNRATDAKRQPGSCFKVLAAFLPFIDSGRELVEVDCNHIACLRLDALASLAEAGATINAGTEGQNHHGNKCH